MSDGTQFPQNNPHGIVAPTPFPTFQPQAPSAFDPDIQTPGQVRYTRAQVVHMRQMENAGVPFVLHRTGGMEAKVRVFSIADKTVLLGMPPELQQAWTKTLNSTNKNTGNRQFKDILQSVEQDENLANMICVVGFIEPRLVMTEAELDGSDDCWLVTDITLDERKRYMSLVLNNGNEDDLKKINSFLASGLELGANR